METNGLFNCCWSHQSAALSHLKLPSFLELLCQNYCISLLFKDDRLKSSWLSFFLWTQCITLNFEHEILPHVVISKQSWQIKTKMRISGINRFTGISLNDWNLWWVIWTTMPTHEDLWNGGIMPQRTEQMHVPCSLVQRGRADRRGTRYVHHELSPPPSHSHCCWPHPVEFLLNRQNFSYPVAQSILPGLLCFFFFSDYACLMPRVPSKGKSYPRGYKLQFQGM